MEAIAWPTSAMACKFLVEVKVVLEALQRSLLEV